WSGLGHCRVLTGVGIPRKKLKISRDLFDAFCRLSVSTHTRDLHIKMNHNGETRRATEAILPHGSTLGTFSVERRRKSKYRVTLSAMLGDEKVRVVWRSSIIKSRMDHGSVTVMLREDALKAL
ncbi:unnamed protein product, partial [Choristocarpus tenellus]